MKYFEKNVMHGADYIVLHQHLTKASAVAANNLFFQEAIDDMESEEHRVILAKCAYTVIGICEAIIDMVPADEREKAFAEVRESFEPIDCDNIEKLIKIILEKL